VGSISFDGFVPWVNLQVIHDPGKSYALAGGVLALLGAMGMLFIHRRRIWIRFASEGERSSIEIAGLCTSNDDLIKREIESIVKEVENG
jgi:cytochrome c biogenesis protein